MDGHLPDMFRSLDLDWNSLGYLDWPNRQPPNLTNPINPMFSQQIRDRKRFKGSKKHYKLIEPAIRLASAILASEASIRFIYSMVYERKRLPDEYNIRGKPSYQFRRTTEADFEAIKTRVSQIWHETAKHTEFGPLADLDKTVSKGCTMCYDIDDRNGGFADMEYEDGDWRKGPDIKGNRRYGRFSYITFARRYITQIIALKSASKVHSLRMLAIQFDLATTLCHESMHAINTACDWRSRLQKMMAHKYSDPTHYTGVSHEPYFEDQALAEVGHAWETEVLGGVSGGIGGFEEAYILITHDWPVSNYPAGLEAYQLENGPRREIRMPERSVVGRDDDAREENFFVSMRYVHELQQQSFWDKRVKQSLRIPRILGYYVDLNDTEAGQLPDSERIVVMRYRSRVPRTICETAFSDQRATKEETVTLFGELSLS